MSRSRLAGGTAASVVLRGRLAAEKTESVTYLQGTAPNKRSYKGVNLYDVLTKLAEPLFGTSIKNPGLRYFAAVTAVDGSDFASPANVGPRLIVPNDVKGGRYAKGKAKLTRNGRVYARGTASVSTATRQLTTGRYTLRVGSQSYAVRLTA
jgi:hypothetical protein